ncbi:MAG: CHAT domain-containing protein, partial [Cyanobacteria bacterium J06598_1]
MERLAGGQRFLGKLACWQRSRSGVSQQRRAKRKTVSLAYGLLGTVVFSSVVIFSLLWPKALLAIEPAAGALQQAQQLTVQGQRSFAQGDAQSALFYWQQAEEQYQQQADDLGLWGSQLNQAKALQTLGFYRRSQALLVSLSETLSAQPVSLLKVNVWLTYGQGLRLLGELPQSERYLSEGLVMAQGLEDAPHRQAAHLYLGNTLVAREQWAAAAAQYAEAMTLEGPLQLTSQLRQLQLLPARRLASQIPVQMQALVSRLEAAASDEATLSARTYLKMDFARWILQTSPAVFSQASASLANDVEGGLVGWLQGAIAQSQALGDRTAESYGWGYLGRYHERNQHWSVASQSTQKALALSQTLRADELTYQWQWQQGRIDRAQGDISSAIAHYSAAVDTLKPLRQEMVAITRDVQFSFRNQIEPIYRDLVSLLLTPASLKNRPQPALEKARQILEDLQVVELNNFFREPCIEAIPKPLDRLDPTAAVLYPIILSDRLAVILSVPGEPLSYYATLLSTAEMASGIQQMLDAMRPTSFERERLDASYRLYEWLIAPAQPVLESHQIQTLVFVLDDALRNLPIAALSRRDHNGSHYLIEDYQLSISPGLQLLQPSGPAEEFASATALVGGLSAAQGDRPALAGVQAEVTHIQTLLDDTKVLLNETFTNEALIAQSRQRSFDIVHLATHAQFGETDEETFIETWDGTLKINQLRQLLRQQDTLALPPALLILSACDTAQGSAQAVLGMAGLAVRSGAQSTLATLWRVNDQATAMFVQQFYDGLIQQQLSRAEAVQYAQQQLLKKTA